MRKLGLFIIALFVALPIAVVAVAASAAEPVKAEAAFGPVQNPFARDGEKSAIVSQSAWYIKHDAASRVDQCNILIDSTGPADACLHRVTVMCTQEGVGYSRGYGQFLNPVQFPLVLELYRPPSTAVAGYIEIGSLGPVASIGLNAPATANWRQAATYQGGSCDAPPDEPPAPSGPHYARLCRQYGLYCGR